jgi:hypothetical protein
VALLGLLASAGAAAKVPVESGASEGPPGITVTGIGFAPTTSEAAAQAVHDARRRAGSIARVLRLDLGGTDAVELPDLARYGAARPCRGREKRSAGCRRAPIAAAATVTYAIVGGGTGEAMRSIRSHGSASALVEAGDRSRNRAIKRAVLATRRKIIPEAALAAWRSARVAADAADLDLGPIVSVRETVPSYYGSSFYDAALGSFGSGRFCGIVRVPVVRRDPETGVPKVVRRVPRRRCFVPSPYSVSFAIEYEAR